MSKQTTKPNDSNTAVQTIREILTDAAHRHPICFDLLTEIDVIVSHRDPNPRVISAHSA
jgi:hypothetical protein